MLGKHGATMAVNAPKRPINQSCNQSCVLRQAYDPAAQFLDTAFGLV
jgi:hypothetical protein